MPPFKPTHVSHKLVEAYPLVELQKRDDGRHIAIVDVGGYRSPIEVPANITARGEPEPGSMLVRYEPDEAHPEGYIAFSPRGPFEGGYRPTGADLVDSLFGILRETLTKLGPSREASVTMTNLDTARLWAGKIPRLGR
ncbi:hypothetical protein [Methylobacterium iners]|uniref:Uncharacterized protein n=1 Tax=Methylobacterium iners TaxID=418707 RepID=A0ABQ4RRV8_9HYPH|nr:hypothetical protein [Methylobacterium iners]GJD92893.1 hypothetical protein OCOJLMKI_0076 [Methylobacterium iners]